MSPSHVPCMHTGNYGTAGSRAWKARRHHLWGTRHEAGPEDEDEEEEDQLKILSTGREGGWCELGHVLQGCQSILWVLKHDNETRVVNILTCTRSRDSSRAASPSASSPSLFFKKKFLFLLLFLVFLLPPSPHWARVLKVQELRTFLLFSIRGGEDVSGPLSGKMRSRAFSKGVARKCLARACAESPVLWCNRTCTCSWDIWLDFIYLLID